MKEGSENEEEEHDEEEENTDYLTDSNKENETDEENNVSHTRAQRLVCHLCFVLTLFFHWSGGDVTWRGDQARGVC